MANFESDTRDALVQCAKWLENNADDLAHVFAEGCRQWSVEFSAGVEGIFPEIKVSVNKVDRDILNAYRSKESAEAMEQEKWF